MIKYFCEKCGKEIPKNERVACEIYIRRISVERIDCDFCQECLSSIVGKDRFCELIKKYEERRMRVEERKKARLKAHPTEKGGVE